jgi:hypothetical protein
MLTPEQKAARKLLRDLGLGGRISQADVWYDAESGFYAMFQRCIGGDPIAWFSSERHAYARANRINRALGFPEVGP